MTMSRIKKTLAYIAVLFCLAVLTGCNYQRMRDQESVARTRKRCR